MCANSTVVSEPLSLFHPAPSTAMIGGDERLVFARVGCYTLGTSIRSLVPVEDNCALPFPDIPTLDPIRWSTVKDSSRPSGAPYRFCDPLIQPRSA